MLTSQPRRASARPSSVCWTASPPMTCPRYSGASRDRLSKPTRQIFIMRTPPPATVSALGGLNVQQPLRASDDAGGLVFHGVAQASPVRRRRESELAQLAVQLVYSAAVQRGAGLESRAEGDRHAVAVPDPVRIGRGDVQAVTRLQLEHRGALLVALVERHVAVNRRPREVLLQLELGQHFPVGGAEHADRLAAADLQQ